MAAKSHDTGESCLVIHRCPVRQRCVRLISFQKVIFPCDGVAELDGWGGPVMIGVPGTSVLIRRWQAMMISTCSAHIANAASVSSSWLPRSPLVCRLEAGKRQGVILGQPLTISVGAGEGGALVQPNNVIRQSSIGPALKCVIFTL